MLWAYGVSSCTGRQRSRSRSSRHSLCAQCEHAHIASTTGANDALVVVVVITFKFSRNNLSVRKRYQSNTSNSLTGSKNCSISAPLSCFCSSP
jgi:hypothetical protein